MRSVLLANPVAGRGRASGLVAAVADRLRRAGDVRVVTTRGATDTFRAATEAVANGADVLAVLGGDGIAHEALQACAHSPTALAVIPSGTGNDLARALDLPPHPAAAASAVATEMAAGRRRSMDLGKVAGGSWFATVLCAGFDARVNARVNRMRWPHGTRRYDVAVVREMLGLHAMPLRVETGTGVVDIEATLVAVGNTTTYGGGIPVCPDADPRDGELDLTVVGKVNRRALLRILPTLRTGAHIDHPAVRTLRARSVRLGGENGWFAYADGEPQARLPLSVQSEPAALDVLAPRL